LGDCTASGGDCQCSFGSDDRSAGGDGPLARGRSALRLGNVDRVAPPLRRPEDRVRFIESLRRQDCRSDPTSVRRRPLRYCQRHYGYNDFVTLEASGTLELIQLPCRFTPLAPATADRRRQSVVRLPTGLDSAAMVVSDVGIKLACALRSQNGYKRVQFRLGLERTCSCFFRLRKWSK
jgi:hypothetical protein